MVLKSSRRYGAAVSIACAWLSLPCSAQAQSGDDFYRGKTISMVIGYAPGGSNDLYARTVARHIGKHLPGNPTAIPRNMPGGGSLAAANHIYNVAPKDGTTIGLIASTLPLEARLGASNVMFKSSKFNWIGRVAPGVNISFVRDDAPVKTIQDAYTREVILAATGRSSALSIYPAVLANVTGVKFKLVMGYSGSATAMLAMERGEVEGFSTSMEALRSVHPEWIPTGKVKVLVQYALNRHPELPDVPMAWELGRTPDEKQILRIVANATEVGKPVLAPPDMPAERVTQLRRAFDATMKDPEFMAELQALRIEQGPMSGEDLQKLIEEVDNVSPDIIEKVKAIYPLN
jgi:tripartite-type tricarboxylate transporter receptor subunit TctC